ncbi:hypothetical protein [Flavisolibacter tropicus]|uniref:Uncharacterized protein n=1 Tax=Flavisolibacter tropicus TaxID=1492898 RepID=A0A172TZB0_9BACT|nr:hypothetical protein [Flavisolibacter tropicus]ANE52123.1 hypothetical protein SY85_18110 [Flavisolibacter tropicus]
MQNNLVLTMSVLDETTEVRYVIPQRGVGEIEAFNVWGMEKPGFYVLRRPITIEEDNFHFIYQSVWLECYFKNPDGKELLFRFIASNDHETNSLCIASVLDGDNLVLPEFRFSLNDFDLDKLFTIRRPIVELYQIKAETGKEYILQLSNE